MKTRCIFLAVFLICSASLHAAVDSFLKLDDVQGESQDAQFPDHIEVESWSWGITGAPPVLGGGGAGKATFQGFNFTKTTDKSSPVLMLGCASGKHYQQATITMRKAGDKPVVYLKITLNDVLISGYSVSGASSSSSLPSEQVSLSYAKIKIEYFPQKPDGSISPPVVFSWDLAANRAI